MNRDDTRERISRAELTLLFCFIFLWLLATNKACANNLTGNCPYRGQTFTSSMMKPLTDAHQQWLASDRKTSINKLNLCDTTLQGLKLSGLNLSHSNFSGSDLSHTNLNGTDLSYTQLIKTYFRNADLAKANLQYANMEHAILEEAKLINADLKHANLTQTNLIHANLKGANMLLANLVGANLSGADLSGADLRWANLSHADLSGANLTGAHLENANLTFSNLQAANLTNAHFAEANIQGAIYQPKLSGLPNLNDFHTIKHFHDIRFEDINSGRAVLTELRTAYQEIGIRSMERLITAIIKYKEMIATWHSGGLGYLESAFNYLFFYITCNFDAQPGRPLGIALMAIFFFVIPYRFALSNATRFSGIVAIWTPNRFRHWDKTKALHKQPEQFIKLLQSHPCPKHNIAYQFRLLRLSLFFSALSAFSIGWKDVNVSNWISHLQSREYTLKGKGWVRVFAGIQALLSAYLIVLWLFTYFGRPFEW